MFAASLQRTFNSTTWRYTRRANNKTLLLRRIQRQEELPVTPKSSIGTSPASVRQCRTQQQRQTLCFATVRILLPISRQQKPPSPLPTALAVALLRIRVATARLPCLFNLAVAWNLLQLRLPLPTTPANAKAQVTPRSLMSPTSYLNAYAGQ